jgi:hypothetical protein
VVTVSGWLNWLTRSVYLYDGFACGIISGCFDGRDNRLLGILLFLFLQVAIDRFQVAIDFYCVAVAHLTRLFNNFVVPHKSVTRQFLRRTDYRRLVSSTSTFRFTAVCISDLNPLRTRVMRDATVSHNNSRSAVTCVTPQPCGLITRGFPLTLIKPKSIVAAFAQVIHSANLPRPDTELAL